MSSTHLNVRFLPEELTVAWREARARWSQIDGTARLFQRDASLFTGADEDRWLGWLDLPNRAPDPQLDEIASRVREGGIRRVVLLGMGGSSLGAEALVTHLAGADASGAVGFTIVDTTEPEAVASALSAAESEPTLVMAASKSGGTLETELLLRVFAQRVPSELLAVITDPGSKLERWARDGGARWTLLGDPAVGGRFSVLSPFGVAVPRAMGLDVDAVLVGARRAEAACRSDDAENPGLALGALMAAASVERPLLSVVAGSPGASAFGDWLEQLVAESLGKGGRGLLPIVGERVTGPCDVLDRRDARLVLAVEPAAPSTAELERAGLPVVSVEIDPAGEDGGESLGFELFRCEVATAVAGALIGVHPFDQPNVEAAKQATRVWIERAERGEVLESGARVGESPGVAVFCAPGDEPADPSEGSAVAALDRVLGAPGDASFCALLAFLPSDESSRAALENLREAIADRYRLATTVGLGPRYLHSTGQFHKGGPDCGLFLVLSRAIGSVPESAAVDIPGQASGFAQVHAAQALGDFEALTSAGRRALRIEMSGNVAEALTRLAASLADSSSSVR